uniref:Uncharacterized protein n=1 Tax=Arundo donax TaxID=35708 RepID=A0A0A9B143_ARUDO
MHALSYNFGILLHGLKKTIGFIIGYVRCKALSKCQSIRERKVRLQLHQQ